MVVLGNIEMQEITLFIGVKEVILDLDMITRNSPINLIPDISRNFMHVALLFGKKADRDTKR